MYYSSEDIDYKIFKNTVIVTYLFGKENELWIQTFSGMFSAFYPIIGCYCLGGYSKDECKLNK